MNSFAVGRRSDSAIAITHGMLRHLSMRELMAILAHEVSHIAGNDIWVMQIADMIMRMTRMMALIGLPVGCSVCRLRCSAAATYRSSRLYSFPASRLCCSWPSHGHRTSRRAGPQLR